MKVLRLILVLVTLFGTLGAVKVSVFYEALCSDSVHFITRQLYPAYDKLKNHLDLDFVPYGKALHSKLHNGNWFFQCQHGPPECKGNKFQACALQIKDQDTKVNFINCVMMSRNPSNPNNIKTCAIKHDLDYNKIRSCASSLKGDELLAAHGNRTWDVVPNLSFVPTIVYENIFEQVVQDQTLIDFTAVVCSKLTNEEKPAICENRRLPRTSFFDFFS